MKISLSAMVLGLTGYGASATAQAVGGIVPVGQLAMLGAFALLALGLSPLVVMAGLRIAVES